MKLIPIIEFMRVLNLGSNEEQVRDWLIANEYPVTTRRGSPTSAAKYQHCMEPRYLAILIENKEKEISRSIDRLNKEIAEGRELYHKLTTEIKDND